MSKRSTLTRLAALALLATGLPGSAGPVPYRSGLPVRGAMPGFDGAVTWLNSAPLSPRQLRGKVVLVEFWTYSCINCIRTLPWVRAWADKYREQGLVVIGVHTPEFDFEQDLANVNAAVARFGIDFPVAVDSRQRIWDAWNNYAWPACYLVDAQGRIRHQQLGEGGYARMEGAIQSLLAEARGTAPDTSLVAPPLRAEQALPDLGNLRSHETYVGYRRGSGLRSPEAVRPDVPRRYSVGRLDVNGWGFAGQWTVGAQAALGSRDSAIAHQFSARDLHLVMGGGGRPLRFKVTLDGRAPGPDHGADIDAEGNGVLTATRLYQLIRQDGAVKARRFEIRFVDPGAEVYAFTFG